MKIDDVLRETLLKSDSVARGKADIAEAGSADSNVQLGEKALEVDSTFPDLLQAFSRVIAKREQWLTQLPDRVKSYVSSALNGNENDDLSGLDRQPGLQQGAAGMLREGRTITNTLRQMADEIEFVDRIPGLSGDFADEFSESAVNRTSGEIKANPGQQTAARDSVTIPPNPQLQYSGVKLQQAVDQFLRAPDMPYTEPTPASVASPSPATVLATLVNKAVATETVGEELNRWISVVDAVIGKATDSPETMTMLTRQMDPQWVQLAEATGKPELLRAAAIIQELAGTPVEASTLSTPISAGNAATSLMQMLPPASKTVLNNLVQSLMAATASQVVTEIASAAQVTVAFRVNQLEMFIASLTTDDVGMANFMAELPNVVASLEKMLPARETSKSAAAVYDTLARSVPKWLRSLAQQADSADLLSFWVAAKVADLLPWLQLTSEERRQSAELLRNMATTYEQPENFRAGVDDGNARSLTFQMALYAPGRDTPYPALVQIFEEKREQRPGQTPEQEVWVRVSLETDHIGPVDLSFRLQDKTYLSIFTRFARPESVEEFKEYLPEIRAELAGTSLQLKKIAITGRTSAKGA